MLMAASLPLGRNKEGWRHGASAHGDIWASRRLNASYSLSLRGRFTHKEAISGADARIDKPVQSANPDYYGGQQAELALSVNFIGGGGALHGHRLALEYTRPVWRNLNGPQMGNHATLTLGYQKSFLRAAASSKPLYQPTSLAQGGCVQQRQLLASRFWRARFSAQLSPKENKIASWQALIPWRTERDSNPRDAINAYTLSKRAPSATRPPVHPFGEPGASSGLNQQAGKPF